MENYSHTRLMKESVPPNKAIFSYKQHMALED
jgi:hypothetical protein